MIDLDAQPFLSFPHPSLTLPPPTPIPIFTYVGDPKTAVAQSTTFCPYVQPLLSSIDAKTCLIYALKANKPLLSNRTAPIKPCMSTAPAAADSQTTYLLLGKESETYRALLAKQCFTQTGR